MLSVINPATDEMIKQLVTDSAETIAQKVEQARLAQKSWFLTPLEERKAKVQKFRELLAENMEDCAKATSLETGRPFHQVCNEIRATDPRIGYFIDGIHEQMKTETVYKDDELEERVSWEPLGLVVNISAWNYPYFVGTNVFIPALLAGNAVLYKASEYASLTGGKITELMNKAGFPKGVFTSIVGDGSIGKVLLDEKIDAVFFTGSHGTGQKINQGLAPKLVKVGMELGGKDPCYITEDVDVKSAAAAAADGAFYNCGQSCCAVERIYVHEKVYDEFKTEFLEQVKGFKVGDPFDENTYLGPLTRKQQIEVLQDQINDAVKKGAVLELGGNEGEGKGSYFEPTVFTDVDHQMKLMRDESFGPIIGIQKVSSDQEAVDLMNDTDFGLTASVYCRDKERAVNMMYHLDAGTVYSNCCDRVSPHVPWSGRAASGIGSTLGEVGIQAFLQPKSWQLK